MCNRGHSQGALPFSVLGECKRYARKKINFLICECLFGPQCVIMMNMFRKNAVAAHTR
jgi:hypothetical protein